MLVNFSKMSDVPPEAQPLLRRSQEGAEHVVVAFGGTAFRVHRDFNLLLIAASVNTSEELSRYFHAVNAVPEKAALVEDVLHRTVGELLPELEQEWVEALKGELQARLDRDICEAEIFNLLRATEGEDLWQRTHVAQLLKQCRVAVRSRLAHLSAVEHIVTKVRLKRDVYRRNSHAIARMSSAAMTLLNAHSSYAFGLTSVLKIVCPVHIRCGSNCTNGRVLTSISQAGLVSAALVVGGLGNLTGSFTASKPFSI